MKKHRKAKKFLDELGKVPVVSVVCERVGLSRNTVYRWRNEDPDFRKMMDKALDLGIESISDLAESKQLQHIQQGEPWAIKYWLDNHKARYARRKIERYQEEEPFGEVRGFSFHVIKNTEQLEKFKKLQAYQKQYGPLND